MYTLVVYFNGPLTRWSGRVHAEETLLQEPQPFLWSAKWRGASLTKYFVEGRACWVVLDTDRKPVAGTDPAALSPEPSPA